LKEGFSWATRRGVTAAISIAAAPDGGVECPVSERVFDEAAEIVYYPCQRCGGCRGGCVSFEEAFADEPELADPCRRRNLRHRT
jgi:hypothetical protein